MGFFFFFFCNRFCPRGCGHHTTFFLFSRKPLDLIHTACYGMLFIKHFFIFFIVTEINQQLKC